MTVQIAHRPFTVAEYYRMAEVGILSEEDRVELVEGRIVTMSPIGSRHAACVDRLNRLFNHRSAQNVLVRVQNPIRLDDFSEPEPDLALLHPRDDFYAEEHPAAADVLLVLEVADTSEEYDRDVKVPLYARTGIPEVWLVSLSKNLTEIYTQPVDGTYQNIHQAKPGETVYPQGVPGLTIPVDELLG